MSLLATMGIEETGAADSPYAGMLRRQQALVAIGRRAAVAPAIDLFLQDAAGLLAEMLGMEHYGVAELRESGSRLEMLTNLRLTPPIVWKYAADGRCSLGGYALQVALPVSVEDLADETRFEDRPMRAAKLRSALAVPLTTSGSQFGALAAYGKAARTFSNDDVLFAETIAHLVSISIARQQAEQQVVELRDANRRLLNTVDAILLDLDGEGRIVAVNPATERLTGFAPAEVQGRLISSVFAIPREANLFDRILAQLRSGVSTLQYESLLLTKHSQTRNIAWSYAARLSSTGQLESVLVTGLDVTAQRQAEQRLLELQNAPGDTARPIPNVGQVAANMPRADILDTNVTGGNVAAVAKNSQPERRRKPRRPYKFRQWVAPIIDGELPDRNEFIAVACHDISPGGFSFLTPTPPSAESFVVALGCPPRVIYVVAQVAHMTRTEIDGKKMYLVGCNYLGRADYENT